MGRGRGLVAQPFDVTYAVLVRAVAEQDAERARHWYAVHAPAQAERFIDDLAAVVARVREAPHAYPALRRDARRAALKVFPYLLWYRCHDDLEVVEVLALVHERQDASRLRGRLGD